MLDSLSESFKATLKKISKSLFIDEKLINELVKEIQRALLQSDTNVQLVLALSNTIRSRAKEEPPAGMTKREQLVKIVYDELANFLGEESREITIRGKPTQIMLVGLFGSGKTTSAGKLARFYKKRGYKVAVMQTDTWRPAAYEQLQQLAEQVGVDFLGISPGRERSKEGNKEGSKERGKEGSKERTEEGSKEGGKGVAREISIDPVAIYQAFEKKLPQYDVVIIDTAGRDALSGELIRELRELDAAVEADERLLVISADLGQAAQQQAEAFHESCGITGVIVTKLEGTAKGGGALSACAVTGAPIMFIGIGEKLDDLEFFHPQRFAGRLLGMGDIEALLEKAKEAVPEEKAKDMQEKLSKGEFSLVDLYEQMNAMKKMGSFRKIVEMIPGMGQLKLPKEMLDVQEGKLELWKHAMDSMTQHELENPDSISAERVSRIAAGSGVAIDEVRGLLKQYRQAKKLMKMFKGEQDIGKLMKKMGGKMPAGMMK